MFLIKPFQTKKGYYIYSVYLNQFFKITKKIYSQIKYLQENKIGDTKKLPFIKEFEKMGILVYANPKKLIFENSENIEKILNTSLEQLTLNITEECNLRCRYCIYSGKFPYFRTHSTKKMNLDIAKKAILYFLERTDKDKPPVIGYYGGEPLLNFNLIKETVFFIREHYKGILNLHITTNGTCLTKEIIKFLVDNNIHIAISLDGPRSIHDRYRIFRNGRGSFDSIIKNLKMIREIDETYYKTKISFQPVFAPPYKYKEVFEFFENKELFENAHFFRAGHVSLRDSKIELEPYNNKEKTNDIRYFVSKAIEYILSKPNNYNKLYEQIFMKDLVNLYTRYQGAVIHVNEFMHVPGICFPGKRRLFVDCNGYFHICEKVEPTIPIGNVEKGFDFEQIKGIINEYLKLSEEECLNCWAIRLCRICFYSVIRGGKLDAEYKKFNCEIERRRLLNNFILYFTILEKKPEVFSEYENVEIL